VPGAFAPWARQVKQALQAGVQAHDPQSTAFLQLFVTLPHFPAHVCATDSARHFFR
jgi:hypothetical protein